MIKMPTLAETIPLMGREELEGVITDQQEQIDQHLVPILLDAASWIEWNRPFHTNCPEDCMRCEADSIINRIKAVTLSAGRAT